MKIMTALRRRMPLTRALWLTVGMVLVGCAVRMAAQDSRFTIVALPDTQCYVDHNNEKAAGLSFDTADQLFAQMRQVVEHVRSAGGDIVFVTTLGD